MEPAALHAPWRIEYLRSLDRTDGCFLCDAGACPAGQRRPRLVLWTTAHSVVLLNRFPYSNGHLLIAPLAHKAGMEDLSAEELLDLHRQTIEAMDLLRSAISAQGFNIGINLGRSAGAGVPGHVHQHVVPRWAGDTNFMAVVGQVRVVPQAMLQLYDELMACRQKPAEAGVQSVSPSV